jgi:uncharacterized membrane protein YhaH (DUF805 family)
MKKPARSEYFFGCVLLFIGIMVGNLSLDFLDLDEIQNISVDIVMCAAFILVFTVLMELIYLIGRKKGRYREKEGLIDIPATTIILLLVAGFLVSVFWRLVGDVTGMKEFIMSQEFKDFVTSYLKEFMDELPGKITGLFSKK